MSESERNPTIAFRVEEETKERLQTVADARGISKSEYGRAALKERLNEDFGNLDEEDQIVAAVRDLKRELDGEKSKGGLPDPLGLFA